MLPLSSLVPLSLSSSTPEWSFASFSYLPGIESSSLNRRTAVGESPADLKYSDYGSENLRIFIGNLSRAHLRDLARRTSDSIPQSFRSVAVYVLCFTFRRFTDTVLEFASVDHRNSAGESPKSETQNVYAKPSRPLRNRIGSSPSQNSEMCTRLNYR